jgi:hypothetical protein
MGKASFHDLADRELNEAAQYYELETPGLGSAFVNEVERCVRAILQHPEPAPRSRVSYEGGYSSDSRTPFSTPSKPMASASSRS